MDATIKNKRRALSQLTEIKQKRLKNQKILEHLMKKYLAHGKPLDKQIEILKQEILALKNKIERYTT